MDQETQELIKTLINKVGYETDNEGQIVIYTGLYESDVRDDARESLSPAEFRQKYGIIVNETLLRIGDKRDAHNHHYDVELSYKDARYYRRITVPYMHGSAMAYDQDDVLYAVSQDLSVDTSQGFESFASDFGYDEDSLSAFRIFEAIAKQQQDVRTWARSEQMYQDFLNLREPGEED